MNKSETIGALSAALAKAQAGLSNPVYDAKNPHFKNQYASLASVRNTVTPILAKHGIAVVQLLESGERGVRCETVLMHESGEWISSTLELPAMKQDAQGYGSAATYCRRYALMAICNVVGDEDDDANAAVAPPVTRQSPPKDSPILAQLRAAATNGTAALAEAFRTMPNSAEKSDVWAAHGAALKDAAATAAANVQAAA